MLYDSIHDWNIILEISDPHMGLLFDVVSFELVNLSVRDRLFFAYGDEILRENEVSSSMHSSDFLEFSYLFHSYFRAGVPPVSQFGNSFQREKKFFEGIRCVLHNMRRYESFFLHLFFSWGSLLESRFRDVERAAACFGKIETVH